MKTLIVIILLAIGYTSSAQYDYFSNPDKYKKPQTEQKEEVKRTYVKAGYGVNSEAVSSSNKSNNTLNINNRNTEILEIPISNDSRIKISIIRPKSAHDDNLVMNIEKDDQKIKLDSKL